MGVVVLERPAARTDVGRLHRPVALEVEHLPRLQPVEALLHLRERVFAAGLRQRVAGQRGVPHRRDAGLAIGLVLADHQQLVDAPAGDRARRKIRSLAERLIHHDDVGHRRIDRAHAVFAVQPLFGESERARRSRAGAASSETAARRRAGSCRACGTARTSPSSDAAPSAVMPTDLGSCRNNSSMPTPFGFFASGFNAASTISGTIVVRAQ